MVLSPAYRWDVVSGAYLPSISINKKQGYWAAVFGACDLTVDGIVGSAKPFANMNWESFYKNHGKTPPLPPSMDWEAKTFAKIPVSYGLSQNYPNPFNPETTIRYQIVDAVFVRLTIYNTMGQAVRRLVDKQQNAGYYEVVWNGRDESGLSMGSGMYFVILRAGEFSSMRKVVLMK
jgi:hypothetical protein